VRAGDTVVIWKLDRLARTLTDLRALVKEIESKGAQLGSLHDPKLIPLPEWQTALWDLCGLS